MSETGFGIFYAVFQVGERLLYALCLAFFLQPATAKGKDRRRKTAMVCLLYLSAGFFCDWIPVPQGAFGFLLTILLTATAKMLGLERAMAFWLAVLFWNVRTASGLIMESLYFMIEQRMSLSVKMPETMYLHAFINITSFLLCHVLCMAIMLYALWLRLQKERMIFFWRELCYLGLLPIAGILFGQMIARLLTEVRDGVFFQLYERHPAFLAVVPLLALLFYGGAYLTIAFWQDMTALREEQAACFVEQQQTQAILARIQETEQFYRRVRSLEHEMRGHLTNLKGLVKSGAYVELEEYISRVDESIGDFAQTFQTGNSITDVIINDKRRQCLDRGIRFWVDFHYPSKGVYDAFDVGIILQNLLQNALEACEKMPEGERFITLIGKQRGRFFLLEVKNSFTGEVALGEDGLPVTDKKEDRFMHGIGLANVRREVEKYMGELELKADSQEFAATVFLQERSSL